MKEGRWSWGVGGEGGEWMEKMEAREGGGVEGRFFILGLSLEFFIGINKS